MLLIWVTVGKDLLCCAVFIPLISDPRVLTRYVLKSPTLMPGRATNLGNGLKNRSHHFFSVAIDPILFKLTGNEDMRNILDELEFRPDRTTDYGVSCP